MAATSRALNTDPLRSFKFNVVIPRNNDGAIGGSNEARLGFMQMSGLGISIEPLTYREGGDNLTDIPVDAPVLTVNGWKRMGALEVGDRLVEPYGADSKVVEKSAPKVRPVFAVLFGDGTAAEASDRHIWQVQVTDTNGRAWTVQVRTDELKQLVENQNRTVHLDKMAPFEFDVSGDLPIHPYLLGLLLAEGHLDEEGISVAMTEPEIIEKVREVLPPGHFLGEHGGAFRISVGNIGRANKGANLILNGVRELGLVGCRSWEKFIPEMYLRASCSERQDLLRGILDGDGWVDATHCAQFSSSSERLARDVKDLIVSLGGRCGSICHRENRTYHYGGEQRACRDMWAFSGITDIDFVPFTLRRKVERFALSAKSSSQFRRIRSVKPVGEKTVQCILVSADSHLFVHANVFSHNTRKMPGQADFNPITLSRGMFAVDNDNWLWMQEIFTVLYGTGPGVPASATGFRTVMYINVLEHPNTAPVALGNAYGSYNASYPNQNEIVKISFKLYSAWVSTLAYSDLDAGGNAVGIEQMSLNYEGFDAQFGGNGYVSKPTSW